MEASLSSWQDQILLAICTIGFLSFTKQILIFTKWFWSMFIRSPKKLTNYGKWALVTGCTDGIGKALSFELASKGLNLILVGINTQSLQATSNEILKKHDKENIEIKIIVIDFAKIVGEEIERVIRKEIEGLDVGVLVNNVGILSKAKYFHEIDIEGMHDMININLQSATWVTKAVLPIMLKKKKGAIVNIGSASTVALPSFPIFALYAATKGYVAMFSRSLYMEYKQYGIDIQCQTPGFVATNMLPMKISSIFCPSAEQYSKASIRWIGFEHLCVPYSTHALLWCLLNLWPDSLMNWVILRCVRYLRKKVIQKELRQKK